jgi:hypothetical protein
MASQPPLDERRGMDSTGGGSEDGLPLGGTGSEPTRQSSTRPPPRPVRLTGNREYLILVECTAGELVLHPTGTRITTAALAQARGADNPFFRVVQGMVARRQATVRTGEPPYRPQVRFLVRPDGLRAFHMAYPALEGLGLPMTRQDISRTEPVPFH